MVGENSPPERRETTMTTHGKVEYLNPDGLFKSPAFTQAVAVTGPVKTIYVGGQNAVDAQGELVGKGDIATQSEQALKNVGMVLKAGGADWENLVKMNIYLVEGQSVQSGYEAFQKIWGKLANPPAITVAIVAAFANPDFLVEIEGIAVVPD